MGDEAKGAPKEDANLDIEKLSEALGVNLSEDEQTDSPSKKEELKETPEEKVEEKETGEDKSGSEEKESVVDEDSLKIELDDLRKLKGKLGEELGLKKKEAEYYKNQYEAMISKQPEKKLEVEDKFAKLSTITDPTVYAKEVVSLATENAQKLLEQEKAKISYQTTVWTNLVNKYPELADNKSDMYIQTDALMKARKVGLDNAEMAEVMAELVKSQLKLTSIEKEKSQLVEDSKKKKIEKSKQSGVGKQPAPKTTESPKWDSMSASDRKTAIDLGLGPKDFEEA